MAKQGEIDYLARIGPEGVAHARGKPFTDGDCGGLLANMAALFKVLPPPPARVLDLGCGSGWTSVFLARRGYEVVGQDISADMIALAEANGAQAGAGRLAFVVSDYESLDLGEAFDAVVFHDALHHAVDPAAAIACAWRALKPDGLLVTLEPGAGHAASEVARHAMAAFDVTERDMPPALIWRLAARSGFRSARVHPLPSMLAALHYGPPPRWWPGALAHFYPVVASAWIALRRGRYSALMALRK